MINEKYFREVSLMNSMELNWVELASRPAGLLGSGLNGNIFNFLSVSNSFSQKCSISSNLKLTLTTRRGECN